MMVIFAKEERWVDVLNARAEREARGRARVKKDDILDCGEVRSNWVVEG